MGCVLSDSDSMGEPALCTVRRCALCLGTAQVLGYGHTWGLQHHWGTRREPPNSTPMGVHFDFVRPPASAPCVRPMGRTRRWADEIKGNPRQKKLSQSPLIFRGQGTWGGRTG